MSGNDGKHWCEVGARKQSQFENPRHLSFWKWGYDECPICAKVICGDWTDSNGIRYDGVTGQPIPEEYLGEAVQ